jgi:hypothetical protein
MITKLDLKREITVEKRRKLRDNFFVT